MTAAAFEIHETLRDLVGRQDQMALRFSYKRIVTFFKVAFVYFAQLTAALATDLTHYEVKPSEANPRITRFDEANEIVFDPEAEQNSQLVVFMPGTNGKPSNAWQLYNVIAAQGYHVIGLEYNNSPAVVQVCPRDPRPDCSANFRQKRIFGDNVTTVVDNTPAESIVSRLVALLLYLDEKYPTQHWSRYLLRSNEPNWDRIVVSGFSQGAGMAAFIAKRKMVARVVLFSSPWDFQEPSGILAPWLDEPSMTPQTRWFSAYHRREETAPIIRRAYAMLRIPANDIRVFDLDDDRNYSAEKINHFHTSTIMMKAYAPEWAILFGVSP
jgi:dienelactone hydrolase